MRRAVHRRADERGFAMLLIFVLAAGIGIALMMQLPRVAFETARNREEMLIERGEQYKRAIGLFYRKNNRLPQKLEDLENTNNIRFLRRRYIDPMTGKDEWRVIHAGPGGVLTDSLIKKASPTDPTKGGAGGTQSAQNFGLSNPGNTTGTNSTDPNNPQADGGVNAAVLRRPSDRTPVAGAGVAPLDPAVQQAVASGAPIYPGQPGYPQPGTPNYTGAPIFPGQPGYPQAPAQHQGDPNSPGQGNNAQATGNGQPIFPGQPGYPQPGTPGYTGLPIYPGQPGYPSATQSSTNAANNGQNYNPMQNLPGAVNPAQVGQMPQPGMPQQPGYTTNPGQQPGGANGQQQAMGMINDMLRNPRNPPPGVGGSAFNNQGMQGGIAGFASNFKGPSIKIYKERQKYQEWEFVYDLKDDPYLKRQQMGGQGLNNSGLNTTSNPGNTGLGGGGGSFNNGTGSNTPRR